MSASQTAISVVQNVEGQRPGLVSSMAEQYGVAPAKFLDAVREQCFPKREGKTQATTEQLLAFLTVANVFGLNPFTREIYAFLDKGGNVRPVVSVDGWVSLINRQPRNDGFEFDEKDGSDGKPLSSTCTIWVTGRTHPIKVTEYYAECYRNTDPWNQMPRRMLRHKSLIQAGRYAFGFAGIQDEDEARDTITVEPVRVPQAQLPPSTPVDAEQQKKITEFHVLAEAAGMNTAARHMLIGKHNGNLDAAIAEVKEVASKAPEPEPKRSAKRDGQKAGTEPKPSGQGPAEAATPPNDPELNLGF